MASRTTSLTVQVITDATRAASGLQDTANRFESFSKKAAGAVAGFFVADKIAQGVKAVVSAASDMQQAMGGTDKIFGTSAQAIHKWAADTTDDFRVPAVAAEKFATSIGNSLIQAGQSTEQATSSTKELGMVAADLAAAYGGNLLDALDAVNAAISKGEWERLESFGVTVKASDVAAEVKRIADSFGGLNDETRPVIENQAKINLLMREAAPAAGAAAAEANTFASKMDSLKEKLGNAAATVGGPLLDSLGNLADGLSDGVDSFAPFVTGIAGAVSNLAALPGPVLAVTAALGGLLLLAPRFVGFFSGIGNGISGFVRNARTLQTSAANAGRSISTFGALARTAGTGLLGALGGGWGIAFAGAAIVATLALLKWADAAAEAKQNADLAKSAVASFQSTLEEGGNVRATAITNLVESLDAKGLSKTVSEFASDFGLTRKNLIDGLVGTPQDTQAVKDAMNAVIAPLIAERERLLKNRTPNDTAEVDAQLALLQQEQGIWENLIPTLGLASARQQELNDEKSQGAYVSRGQAEALWNEKAGLDATGDAAAKTAEEIKLLEAAFASVQKGIEDAFELGAAQTMLDEIDVLAKRAQRGGTVIRAALEEAFPERRSLRANAVSDLVDQVTDAGKLIKQEDIGGKIKDIFLDLENQDMIKLSFLGDAGQQVRDWATGFQSDWDTMVVETFESSGRDIQSTVTDVIGHTRNLTENLAQQLGIPFEEAEQIVQKTLGNIDAQTLEEKVLKIAAEDDAAYQKVLFYQSVKFNPITQAFESEINLPEPQEIARRWNEKFSLTPLPLPADPTLPPSSVPALVSAANAAAVAAGGIKLFATPEGAPAAGAAAAGEAQAGASAAGSLTMDTLPKGGAAAGSKAAAEAQQGAAAAGGAKVDVTADPGPANATISNEVVSPKRETAVNVGATTTIYQAAISALIADTPHRGPAVVNVDANTQQADEAARSFMTARRQASDVIMDANTSQADEAARAFMTARRQASDIIVGANTGPAYSAISSVMNGYYTATVRVQANTDSFWATFNSLPTSKTVTMTTQQQTVILPPVQAPVLFSAATAPSLSRSASGERGAPGARATATGSQAGANYTINIKGALWPDQAARAVEDVMRRRDRRRGVVTVR